MEKPYNIRTARIKAGLKQRELGEILGVGQTAVSSWETGRYKDIGYLCTLDIARITNIPHELIDFTPEGNKRSDTNG